MKINSNNLHITMVDELSILYKIYQTDYNLLLELYNEIQSLTSWIDFNCKKWNLTDVKIPPIEELEKSEQSWIEYQWFIPRRIVNIFRNRQNNNYINLMRLKHLLQFNVGVCAECADNLRQFLYFEDRQLPNCIKCYTKDASCGNPRYRELLKHTKRYYFPKDYFQEDKKSILWSIDKRIQEQRFAIQSFEEILEKINNIPADLPEDGKTVMLEDLQNYFHDVKNSHKLHLAKHMGYLDLEVTI